MTALGAAHPSLQSWRNPGCVSLLNRSDSPRQHHLECLMSAVADIRRATVSEAAGLTDLALRSKAQWGYDAAFMTACVEEMTVRPEHIRTGEVWVVGGRTGPIGMYELVIDPDGEPAGTCQVRMFFIEPDRIGTGLGRRLWSHLEARARALGLTAIAVDSDPNAEGFYRKMGCQRVGEAPSGSVPGRMLPYLRLDMTEVGVRT